MLATVNNAANVVQYDILQTYNQPIITFVPGVTQPNTYYEVYAIAGNADGSSVDLNDPCPLAAAHPKRLIKYSIVTRLLFRFVRPRDFLARFRCRQQV